MRLPGRFYGLEDILYDYPSMGREIDDLIDELAGKGSSTDHVSTVRLSSDPSDPTLEGAHRLQRSRVLNMMRKEKEAVDRLIVDLDTEGRRFLELNYFKGRVPPRRVMMEMSLSDSSYYRKRCKVVRLLGVEYGMVDSTDLDWPWRRRKVG